MNNLKDSKNSLTFVVSVSLVATLGGLLFGYDTAVISGAIGYLTTHFQLNPVQMGWAAGCTLIGCIIGACSAGVLSDRFGRKRILILSAILFSISAVCSAIPFLPRLGSIGLSILNLPRALGIWASVLL